jgi:predicted O-methyltransferase YrrM
MSSRTLSLDDTLYAYLLNHSLREPEPLRKLRDATASHARSRMQISPEQGQFMRLLVELLDVRMALEVGTFTGYSALSVALALPPDGRLICCDVSEEFTAVGLPYWREAGVADKIDLRIAPATETLQSLIDDGLQESFDMIFIDADKENYDAYYEMGLTLLKPGGLALIDNVLWSGRVADPANMSEDTVSVRALNKKLHADDRVTMSLLPIGDGLTLARKRP